MKNYSIAETFLSVQGEGLHVGRRAFFIRLFGCPIKCEWCDSREAWAGKPKESLSVDSLVARVVESNAEICVITGGEPCAQDLTPLLAELSKLNIARHLETSGAFEIKEEENADFSWVALSPKFFAQTKTQALERADELKFIISDLSDLSLCEEYASSAKNAKALWLHPEWSKVRDQNLLSGIIDFVAKRGSLWRAGWQTHKNYRAR